MVTITSASNSLTQRLGSDLTFPIIGNFVPISGLDCLLQDMQQLLLTVPGEKVFRPDYGCLLRTQIWENIDDAFNNGLASIKAALDLFEPRITVTNVTGDFNANNGLITFQILFTVNTNDTVYNLVFPFRTATAISLA